MCGISGFVGNTRWGEAADPAWIHSIVQRMGGLDPEGRDFAVRALEPLEDLAGRWDELMSFALHRAALERSEVRRSLQELARGLESIANGVRARRPGAGEEEAGERVLQRARDYHWQVEAEVLGK